MADRYYEDGMEFFNPQLHHQFHSEGHAVGELPILSYCAAAGYKVFGQHPWVYRGLVLLIWFLGLFALFKGLELLLDSAFWGAWLALLMNTSPLLVYYSNNFLSDVPALSCAYIGLYFLIRYRHQPQVKWLWWMALAFAMAGWLKLTAAISLIAVVAIWAMELVLPIRFGKGKKLFASPWTALFPLLAALVSISLWYVWAKGYNETYHLMYFSNWTYPIWTLESERIDAVWVMIDKIWSKVYFKPMTLHLTLVLLALVAALFRRQNAFFPAMTVVTATGVLGFLVLQFDTLHDHDYYVINLMVLGIWPLASFFALLAERYPRLFNSLFLKIVLGIFLVMNVTHAQRTVDARYDGSSYNNRLTNIEAFAPQLEQLGIAKNDKVICIPDDSPNITLQLLNRKGWTRYGVGSEDRINERIEDGAKWLIVHDALPEHYQHFQSFMQHPVHEIDGIQVFALE